MDDAVNEITKAYELVKELPPLPWAIYASYSVPWHKTYRQWRSDGKLIVWVNRHAVESLPPRVEKNEMVYDSVMTDITIPVVFV